MNNSIVPYDLDCNLMIMLLVNIVLVTSMNNVLTGTLAMV